MKLTLRKFLAVFVVFLFLFAKADDGDWVFYRRAYASIGTGIGVQINEGMYSADTAQILAASQLPLYYDLSSGSYKVELSTQVVVASNVTTHVVLKCGTYAVPAFLYNNVAYLVESLSNRGLNPRPFSSNAVTNSNRVLYKSFQTYSFICSGFVDPDYHSSVLSFLSRLDASSSNLLSQVIAVGGDVSSLASYAPNVSADLSAVRANLETVAQSVAPSPSNNWATVTRMLFGGLGSLFADTFLAALPDTVRSGITLDSSGNLASASPEAGDYLSSLASSARASSADKLALAQSLCGWSISGDSAAYHDGVTYFRDEQGLQHTFGDLCNQPMAKLQEYSAQVSMRVDTNDVRRLGRSLVDPDSASNVRKRALDQQATQDAIAGALNNRVVPVSVQNWPVDGIKVKFDDPTIDIAGDQFGAIESIDANLQQLRTAFKDWSGVDDGGRWLPVQDAVLTNIYAIAESLLSLTNRNNDVSNILYSVATSNQLHDVQAEADAFLSQAENDYHEISGLFDAERYIEFRHTNLNFLASSQFEPLRQLAGNGTQLPEYVNIQAGSFGSFQFPTVTVPVGHIAPLCNAARWFFRCVWIVLSSLFYWFLGLYAVRFYKWVTGKFTGMGYYMS